MANSNDLFLSILALDAHNRGYHPGFAGLSDAIGGVTHVEKAQIAVS
jgi:hypothetical protein